MPTVIVGGLTATTDPVELPRVRLARIVGTSAQGATPAPRVQLAGLTGATAQEPPRVVLAGIRATVGRTDTPPPVTGPQFYRLRAGTWVRQKVTPV